MTNYLSKLAQGFPYCIAGGYAACPQLASDMDVWVLTGPVDSLEDIADEIREECPAIVPFDMSIANEPEYILDHGVRILKVGTQYPPVGVPMHLMLAECRTITGLLDCFDVSTHQCALNADFEFIKGLQWTPITVPPVELFSTPSTAARMRKIAERYRQFRVAA